MDPGSGAKDNASESGRADTSADHESQKCRERRRLVELLVLASAHPALLDDKACVGGNDSRRHVEPDEVLCLGRVKVHVAKVGTVVLNFVHPLLWGRVNYVAKDKVEDGEGVDSVEHIRSPVEDKTVIGVAMGPRAEVDDFLVHNVTEEEVNRHTKDPSKQDLVVGVDTVVDATGSDKEDRS